MKITCRFDGRTLYECEADTMLAALQQAVKSGADLCGADLCGANLRGAYLCRANLDGAKINWQSHDLIAEILLRAAGHDVQKRMVAGLILVSPDWCWDKFLSIESDLRDWAITTLREYVQDGDNAPEILRTEKARGA